MITVVLAGNIGQDAEVKQINEKEYLSFGVADNERSVDKSTGEVREIVTWYNVLYRGGKVGEYLKKGVKVQVIGTLTIDVYRSERDNTVKVSRSIFANTLQLLSPAAKTEDSATAVPAAESDETL